MERSARLVDNGPVSWPEDDTRLWQWCWGCFSKMFVVRVGEVLFRFADALVD